MNSIISKKCQNGRLELLLTYFFTIEGYERTKNILKSKYSKDSEVANANNQGLVKKSNPLKINKFYKKKFTIDKLREINSKINMIKIKIKINM